MATGIVTIPSPHTVDETVARPHGMAAVAQKVGSVETAVEFFASRAAKSKGRGMMHYLENAPDVTE